VSSQLAAPGTRVRHIFPPGSHANIWSVTGSVHVMDLGRVKNGLNGRRFQELRAGGVSGCDRSDQRLDADNFHDPCQIIGQYRERHLGRSVKKCVAKR
jgi:hypothetical protein